MTAFIPGQAVEYIDDDVHVRGWFVFKNSGTGIGLSTIEVEEIVRGTIRHPVPTANLRAYDPQKAQLDAAEADAATDTLRDLLREAAEALAPLAVGSFYPPGPIASGVRQVARAVLAKIEEALR